MIFKTVGLNIKYQNMWAVIMRQNQTRCFGYWENGFRSHGLNGTNCNYYTINSETKINILQWTHRLIVWCKTRRIHRNNYKELCVFSVFYKINQAPHTPPVHTMQIYDDACVQHQCSTAAYCRDNLQPPLFAAHHLHISHATRRLHAHVAVLTVERWCLNTHRALNRGVEIVLFCVYEIV